MDQRTTTANNLIDEIVYLASLASDTYAIDPMLDVLRHITADLPRGKDPTPQQHRELVDLRQRLEAYLVTQEQMRVFTPNSLALQVEHHFSSGSSRRAAAYLVGVLILITLITIVAGASVREAALEIRFVTIGSVFFAMLHIGAVLLFVLSLRAFTTRLRIAFRWICIGIALLAASIAIQPLGLIPRIASNGLTALVIVGTVLLAAIAAYVGTGLYTKPFRQNAVKLLPRELGIAMLALVVISVSVPSFHPSANTVTHELILCAESIILALGLAAAWFLHLAARKMPELYRKPTRSLQAALSLAALSASDTWLQYLIFGKLGRGWPVMLQVVLVTIMGCAFLYAGYVLNKASRY